MVTSFPTSMTKGGRRERNENYSFNSSFMDVEGDVAIPKLTNLMSAPSVSNNVDKKSVCLS